MTCTLSQTALTFRASTNLHCCFGKLAKLLNLMFEIVTRNIPAPVANDGDRSCSSNLSLWTRSFGVSTQIKPQIKRVVTTSFAVLAKMEI